MRLLTRKIIGYFARILYPVYSACHRCNRPWKIVKSHTTDYTERTGCFALCSDCWGELTPEQRLPFYRELWEEWEVYSPGDENWELIKAAVLNERQHIKRAPEKRKGKETPYRTITNQPRFHPEGRRIGKLDRRTTVQRKEDR